MKGLPLIRRFEGLRLSAYICPAGLPTIGYGNTFYEDGSKVKMGDRITQDRADALLLRTYQEFEDGVKKALKKPVNENQLGALVSFAFNTGLGRFRSSTLLRRVNEDPNSPLVGVEFNKWTRGGGRVLPGLVTRRKAEVELYYS